MASRSLPFKYEVSVAGITTTVTCHGSLLSENVDELKQLIKPMIPICRHIVVDLSDVHYIDSAGLGALISLKVSAASAAYCSLEFINFSPLVKELLNTTKLGQLFSAS